MSGVDTTLREFLKIVLVWFRDYKIPDGKPPNKFAYNDKYLSKVCWSFALCDVCCQLCVWAVSSSTCCSTAWFGCIVCVCVCVWADSHGFTWCP